MTRKREREIIGYVLGEATPSPETRRWLASDDGKRELAGHRRVLRDLDAWGAATASASPARAADALYYGAVVTPLGPVLAAVGARGLVRVSFGRSARAFGAELARRHQGPVIRADERLAPVDRQLARYFRDTSRRYALPIDLGHVSPFQRDVLAAARRIPVGRVVTYGELARRIGRPQACRAVGQALGRNPVPIVIPCHRIVAGGGRLGGYVGGTARKRKLLALEGALAATGIAS